MFVKTGSLRLPTKTKKMDFFDLWFPNRFVKWVLTALLILLSFLYLILCSLPVPSNQWSLVWFKSGSFVVLVRCYMFMHCLVQWLCGWKTRTDLRLLSQWTRFFFYFSNEKKKLLPYTVHHFVHSYPKTENHFVHKKPNTQPIRTKSVSLSHKAQSSYKSRTNSLSPVIQNHVLWEGIKGSWIY